MIHESYVKHAKEVLVAAVVLAADCWRVELTASADVVGSSSHFAICRIDTLSGARMSFGIAAAISFALH